MENVNVDYVTSAELAQSLVADPPNCLRVIPPHTMLNGIAIAFEDVLSASDNQDRESLRLLSLFKIMSVTVTWFLASDEYKRTDVWKCYRASNTDLLLQIAD